MWFEALGRSDNCAPRPLQTISYPNAHRSRRPQLSAQIREAAEQVGRSLRSAAIASSPSIPNVSVDGHFAGPDEARLAALREVMADPSVDAVWFARGGYGSNRIAEAALADLPEAARNKTYMGYSDAGFLLAGLHKAGIDVAWGPMPQDVLRDGGEAAVARALDWLVQRDPSALEPELEEPAMAFNLTVLSNLLGTSLEPDFARRRSARRGRRRASLPDRPHDVPCDCQRERPAVRRIRLGRVCDIFDNDPEFGSR